MDYEQGGFDMFYHLTSSALKSIQRLKVTAMLPYGLGGTHTICIRQLSVHPDGLTRTELVELCDVDKAQISRIINDLCSKGYATETEGEKANYKKRLQLTALGRDVSSKINRQVERINAYVRDDISQKELKAFYDTLTVICERLKQAEECFDDTDIS